MASRLFARRHTATVNGKGIEVGSAVSYSRDFLRSTGQYTGTAPFAKGTVTALQPLSANNNLAVIDWGKDSEELPNKVLTSNLILYSNRHLELASKKKATTIVSKQTLEQAIEEAQAIVEQLLGGNSNDERLDQLQEAISFLETILKKSPMEMQQEGASTLDDYLDDAVMPEMAQKIKQDVDMIAKMKNAGDGEQPDRFGNLPSDSTVEMNNRAGEWDKQTLKDRPTPTMASSNDFINDRDEQGEPKAPELAEVPRLASNKKAAPASAPVAPAAPAPAPAAPAPSADITQLSSDTLAKMQKALAGSEDLMNDKAAQAFIAAIAEELMNRPVEVEQEQPVAPAAMPMAASFDGLNLASSDDDGDDDEKTASAPEGWEGTVKKMKKEKDIDNPWALAHWMENRGYTSHKGSVLLKQVGARQLVAAMNRDLQAKLAATQGGAWYATDADTGTIKEDGGRTPEVAEAHGKLEDNTRIKRPATELPSKFAGDMTTGKALKTVEKLGNELKSLYFEAKPVTEVLDSRPVREAIEAIYRAYDLMGEAAKVLNKQNMQEQAEEKAFAVKDKNKKKSSVLFDLALAGEE